jgi:hypothetical protein
VGLFWRVRRQRHEQVGHQDAGMAELAAFARGHTGVEGFIEPRTTVTETTLVLVAGSGEWTRRRVPGPEAAWAFGQHLGVPVYEAVVVGYPDRMRAWNSKVRAAARAREAQSDPDHAG